MKKKLVLIIKDLDREPPISNSAMIEDLRVSLISRGYSVDGVFIEVKSKTAYAWRNQT